MADAVTFKIHGLEELQRKFKGLSEETSGKASKFALLKAAQLVAREAAQKWRTLDDPETGQSIADNIYKQGVSSKGRATSGYPGVRFGSRASRATGNLYYRVGVSGAAKLPKKGEEKDTSHGSPTPHWRLLEFGTESIAAKGFMRQTITENIHRATNEFVEEYGRALDRAVKRGLK